MILTRCFFDMFLSAEKVLYLLVSALGVGCLFQTPLIGLQAAMPLKDMATSTSTFGFIRTLGGTVGISVGQAILSGVSSSFNNIQCLVIPFFNIVIIITSLTNANVILLQFLKHKVAQIPGLNIDTSPAALNQFVRQVKHIQVSPSIFIYSPILLYTIQFHHHETLPQTCVLLLSIYPANQTSYFSNSIFNPSTYPGDCRSMIHG